MLWPQDLCQTLQSLPSPLCSMHSGSSSNTPPSSWPHGPGTQFSAAWYYSFSSCLNSNPASLVSSSDTDSGPVHSPRCSVYTFNLSSLSDHWIHPVSSTKWQAWGPGLHCPSAPSTMPATWRVALKTCFE